MLNIIWADLFASWGGNDWAYATYGRMGARSEHRGSVRNAFFFSVLIDVSGLFRTGLVVLLTPACHQQGTGRFTDPW